MSLRLFAIYCALVGGLFAYLGWMLGLGVTREGILRTAYKGALVGFTLAAGLSILDSIWNTRAKGPLMLHAAAGAFLGGTGGFIGGASGEILFKFHFSLLLLGWSITGLFIGFSLVGLDLLLSVDDPDKFLASKKKLIKCLAGGGIGGTLGGMLFVLVAFLYGKIYGQGLYWAPAALGFSALGISIGLFIGLAQVLLKDAWIKVENGRWKGKEILLTQAITIIGRAEGCNLGLFGDPNVAGQHAAISKNEKAFFVEDLGSRDGTFVNKKRISEATQLQTEDLIQVGGTRVRFLEVTKD